VVGRSASAPARPALGAVVVLMELDERVVEDVALQARGIADERAARDLGAAAIRVRPGEEEGAAAGLDHPPRTRDRAAEHAAAAVAARRQRAGAEQDAAGAANRRDRLVEAVQVQRSAGRDETRGRG